MKLVGVAHNGPETWICTSRLEGDGIKVKVDKIEDNRINDLTFGIGTDIRFGIHWVYYHYRTYHRNKDPQKVNSENWIRNIEIKFYGKGYRIEAFIEKDGDDEKFMIQIGNIKERGFFRSFMCKDGDQWCEDMVAIIEDYQSFLKQRENGIF